MMVDLRDRIQGRSVKGDYDVGQGHQGGCKHCLKSLRDRCTIDLRDGLENISAPVLLLTGDSDKSVPAETVLPLAAAIPGARFEVLDDAAHLIAVSHADRVNSLLLEHLA